MFGDRENSGEQVHFSPKALHSFPHLPSAVHPEGAISVGLHPKILTKTAKNSRGTPETGEYKERRFLLCAPRTDLPARMTHSVRQHKS